MLQILSYRSSLMYAVGLLKLCFGLLKLWCSWCFTPPFTKWIILSDLEKVGP